MAAKDSEMKLNFESPEELKKHMDLMNEGLKEIDTYATKIRTSAENSIDLSAELKELEGKISVQLSEEAFKSKNAALSELNAIKAAMEKSNAAHEPIDTSGLTTKKCADKLNNINVGLSYEIGDNEIVIMKQTNEFDWSFSDMSMAQKVQKGSFNVKEKSKIAEEFQVYGLAYGGVGMASQDGNVATDSEKKASNTEIKRESHMSAIATRRAYFQLAGFKVKSVNLSERAEKKVKEIGKENDASKRLKKAMDYLKTFPIEDVNLGPLGIGGWFEWTVISSTNEESNRSELESVAVEECDAAFTVAGKAFFAAGAGGGGIATTQSRKKGSGHTTHSGKTYSNIQIKTTKNSAPPLSYNTSDLLLSLRNPDAWSIFPSISSGSNYEFIGLCEIIRDMAAKEKDTAEKNALNAGADTLEKVIEESRIVKAVVVEKDWIRSGDTITLLQGADKYVGKPQATSNWFSQKGYGKNRNTAGNHEIHKHGGKKGDIITAQDQVYLITCNPTCPGYNTLHRESDDYLYYDLLLSTAANIRLWHIQGNVENGGVVNFRMDSGYLCPYETWLMAIKKGTPDFETEWKIQRV